MLARAGAKEGTGWLTKLVVLLSLCVLIRLVLIISIQRPKSKRRKLGSDTCRLAVFLGSGGHTSEMMQLLRALPTSRYPFRTYIITQDDRFSLDKALEFEKTVAASDSKASFDFIHIPRARSVHQRWLTSPLSVLITFAFSVYHFVVVPHVFKRKTMIVPDAILMNGPGTCVPIVAAVYLLRFFGMPSPRLLYVESFARVSSLSLTAKILSHFVDRFVVQWQEAITRGSEFRGCLV